MTNGFLILICFGINLNLILHETNAVIELYLSHIEEKRLSCSKIKHTYYYNLIRGEQQAMYNLKNDQSNVMNEADKDLQWLGVAH